MGKKRLQEYLGWFCLFVCGISIAYIITYIIFAGIYSLNVSNMIKLMLKTCIVIVSSLGCILLFLKKVNRPSSGK